VTAEAAIREHLTGLAEQRGRVVADVERGSYVPFWLLLYHPPEVVRPRLGRALDDLRLQCDSADDFMQQIVAFTLGDSGSPHWSDLAVGWLEAGLPIDERVAAAVDRLVEREGATQAVRHRAFRLVARWRKRGAGAV